MPIALTSVDVALAGVVATAAVGVGAAWISYLTGRESRAHERRLAKDERIFESRSTAYMDSLRDFRKDLRICQQTVSVLSGESDESPDSEAFGEPEEWDDLRARLALFGSPEVLERYDVVFAAFANYFSLGPRDANADWEPPPAFLAQARARVEVISLALDDLEAAMREDLS